MKPEQQSASQPTHLPVRHEHEHEVPTVIHDPEEDMTALGRWFHRLYQEPGRFWGLVGTIVAGLIAAVILVNYLSSTRSESSSVWTSLEQAKKPADKVELAKEYPTSPASDWALLQAASEYYQDGFGDLPNNHEAAMPALKKALDLFDQVAKQAPKDSPLARHALLGKARTLEARADLPKAIEQYKLVAKSWPGSLEAKMAESAAKTLEDPAAASFYKELHAYHPPKATLPDVGSSSLPSSMSLPPLDFSKIGLGRTDPAGTTSSSSFPLLPSPPPSAKSADPTPKAGTMPPPKSAVPASSTVKASATVPVEPAAKAPAVPVAPKAVAPAVPQPTTPASPSSKGGAASPAKP